MTNSHFIARVCDTGIEGARESYKDKPRHLAGSIAGFEACRAIEHPLELIALWQDANAAAEQVRRDAPDSYDAYWEARCKALEIEWVLNCVSAACGASLLSWLPTARGAMHAATILNELAETAR